MEESTDGFAHSYLSKKQIAQVPWWSPDSLAGLWNTLPTQSSEIQRNSSEKGTQVMRLAHHPLSVANVIQVSPPKLGQWLIPTSAALFKITKTTVILFPRTRPAERPFAAFANRAKVMAPLTGLIAKPTLTRLRPRPVLATSKPCG